MPETCHPDAVRTYYILQVPGMTSWSRGERRASNDTKILRRTKVMLDALKRNMSRGNSVSDELDLGSALGDTRAYLYSPVLG